MTSRQPPDLPSLRGLGISAVLLKPVLTRDTDRARSNPAMQDSAVLRARSKALLERIPVLLQRSQAALKRSADVSSRYDDNARVRVCRRPLRVGRQPRTAAAKVHDYYQSCKQGCGLFCFNVSMREVPAAGARRAVAAPRRCLASRGLMPPRRGLAAAQWVERAPRGTTPSRSGRSRLLSDVRAGAVARVCTCAEATKTNSHG